MTDQHKPTNPLLARREKADDGTRWAVGTPQALDQLHEHCARLNAMTGDREWYVIRQEDGKHAIDNRPRRQHRDVPNCTPAEAREIIRNLGLQGSKVCQDILAAIEHRDAAEDKPKTPRQNRMPTRADYIALGVDPSALEQVPA